MLVQSKTFAQKPARAISGHRTADALRGNHTQPGSGTGTEPLPIGDQAAQSQPLTFLTKPAEITSLLDPLGAAEGESKWLIGGHAPARVAYTGVRRLRPTRRRLRRMALPLLLELRFKNPCCRLRRIFDG
jgi:hypothetical protein